MPRPGDRRSALFLVAALSLGLARLAGAQETPEGEPGPERLGMRIVSIKASGKLKGEKPSLNPNIRAYSALLTPLGYDFYRGLDAEIQEAKGQQPVNFRRLPLHYQASVSWSKDAEGRLTLDLSITRPSQEPDQKAPVKVLDLKVKSPSGQHFLVRIEGVYPDGDMLLLVTAQLQP
ncbi:MAG: hypothetical protein AB7N76_22945 [Planctomycetota bacterium]